MGDVVGDVVDFVADAADVVVDVASDAVGAATGIVGQVAGPIADAVSAIPVLGDAVEFVAPLAGPLGTLIGGPIGGMIGNAVGGAFNDGGPNILGALDDALGAVSDALPSPIDGVADNLLDGGTLINGGMAILGGGAMPDLGDLAGKVGEAAGVDLGGVIGAAGSIANGEMPDLGDIGGMAGKVGEMFGVDIGGVVGAAGDIANGELPGLGDAFGAAKSVFGGFGLGSITTPITGAVMGTAAPAAAGIGAGDDPIAGGSGGGSFGFGSGYDVDDYVTYCGQPPYEFNPIGEGGGGWLEDIIGKADDLPGTIFEPLPGIVALDFPNGNTGVVGPSVLDPGYMTEESRDFADADLDDLVFNMPGVNADSAARDALQQLAESGGLGAALAGMAPDDVTALVSRLITPITPAAEAVQSDNDVIVDIDDGMTIDAGGTTGATDAGTADPLGIGIDDITGEPVGAGTDAVPNGETGIPDDAMIEQPAAAAQVDDFSLDGGIDAGADVSAPAEPEFVAPEPVESDFSQQMAQADAAEAQLDNDVDEFFTDLG